MKILIATILLSTAIILEIILAEFCANLIWEDIKKGK